MTPKWEQRFIKLAGHIAGWSKQEKQVGAVLVNSDRHVKAMGYNGPKACFDDSQLTEENSTDIVVHAEVNALDQLADSADYWLTLFVTRHPCAHCAKKLAEDGRIMNVVCPPPNTVGRWAQSQIEAVQILTKKGIEVKYYEC